MQEELLGFVQGDWIYRGLMIAIILVVTFVAVRVLARLLHKVLLHDNKIIPSSTIFVNIMRATIWVISISIILTTCFNVNVSAIIAALGVGGIAFSLGFQDTVSNLIGGLQVSLTKIVKPGDHIEVGADSGIVKDVTWRHTTITNTRGQVVIIPNATINKTALIKLPPRNQVTLNFAVVSTGADLDEVADAIEQACKESIAPIAKITHQPKVFFTEITESGFKGKVSFKLSDDEHVTRASDAALRAIAPLTRRP